jgi:predicted transcriptional regulator
MLQVISVVNEGVDKPTRIMYAAKLSWNPTQRILSNLVEQGLLRETTTTKRKQSRKRYEVTKKGKIVLRYFEGAEDLIEISNILS